MGAAFFTGWQLWQKLVFILGCAIVLTILIGGAKLAHTHWRLRKYSAVAEKERKEQALHREMSQKRRGPGVPRADEVPFGIRALERGVEVEGVWISRGNTPEPSIRNESSGSSIWDFMPKKTPQLDVEKQAQQTGESSTLPKHIRATSNSNITTIRPLSASYDGAASAENLTHKPANQGNSSKTLPAKPARSKHPPPSFAKYSGNPSLYRQSSTVQTFEGIEAVYRASTYLSPEARHGGSSSESYTQSSSGSSSGGSDPISSAAPRLLGQKQRSQFRPRHHSVDFELLNSHRQSQAAETGQLTPRTRKPTQSMELSGYTSEDLPSESDDAGYFGVKPTSKATSAPSSPKENSPSPPKVAALPAAVRRTSIPDVTPFAQFVQTAPSLPRPASLQSPIVEDVKKKTEEVVSNGDQRPTNSNAAPYIPSPTSKATPSEPEQAVSGAIRPSFEKDGRGSQVIRGHGTGFEILKPGSLPEAIMPMEPPLHEKLSKAPPMSLKNYTRSRSRSSSVGSTGRKLQKKKRQSSIDQVSPESTRELGGGRVRISVIDTIL